MPPDVVHYINQYGYLAIFILIFLQEIGFPNPIPNELVLLFSGYLIYSGIFKFYEIFLVAMLADFTGTNFLYFTFREFGNQILKYKPRWLPVSQDRIDSLSSSLSDGGLVNIFICRLTPFIRGYTSVIAGLLKVKTAYFLPISLLSAIVWSGAYIITGWLIGPWWKQLEGNPDLLRNVMLSILVIVLTLFIIKYFLRKLRIRYNSH